MTLLQRIREFLRESQIDRMNRLSNAYWMAKSQWYYKREFASFGRTSVIRNPLLIKRPEFIYVGAGVRIRDGIRLEAVVDGSGRKPRIDIGDNVNIEQNVHIICHSRVIIHKNVSITGGCAIVDTTHPFRDIEESSKIGDQIQPDCARVEICEGAFIGYGAIIMPNVRIGRAAVVGAGAVVTRDIDDYSVAVGAPAKVVEVYRRTGAGANAVRPTSEPRQIACE